MTIPRTLPLLPGLKWTGKLTILSSDGDSYVVQFDAEIIDPRVEFRHVYDRTVLTAMQLHDWTGWRADEPLALAKTKTRKRTQRTPKDPR